MDTLLSSFIKDVGISEEQFMKACQEGRSSPQFNSINRVSKSDQKDVPHPESYKHLDLSNFVC